MCEPKLRLAGRALVVDDASVLLELDEAADTLDDPLGAGLFLRLRAPQAAARFTATVGALHGMRRHAGGSRRVPFWMTAVAGERIDTVPAETRFLLAELADGRSALLFGEFVHPDWDMFQSGQPQGQFHAIGRVVSGGPVYVSDKPGTQDFDLLRKLVLPDGTTLRPRGIGRPTGDCLFRNPLAEPVLLKIFNTNLEAGVLGVFNAHQPGEGGPLRGVIRPGDVAGVAGERFAVHAHGADAIRVLAREEELACALPPLSAAIDPIVPIHCGVAPIGLADMFNSAGAIEAKGRLSPQRYRARLRSPGRFLADCEVAPGRALLNGRSIAFDHDAETGSLECSVPETGVLELDVPGIPPPSRKEPQ